MKASFNKTATESRTGQYFSSFSNSKRAQWAQYRNINQTLKQVQGKKTKIMKASFNKTATESRTGQYFSSFSNSKRAQWAQYRNFNR